MFAWALTLLVFLSGDGAAARDVKLPAVVPAPVVAQAAFDASPPDDLSLTTPWSWPVLLQRFWLVWLAFLGGACGSFLNVVVYRWPRGESLTHPSSRCPACRHPIRPWHNVPVFGWLWLRGRCRDCGERISPRYPLVEALLAALFALLGRVEVFSAAANLPGLSALGNVGSGYTGPSIWLLYAYHAWLWSALLAGALMAFDRQPPPWKLLLATLLVGVAVPLAAPGVHPVAGLRAWPAAWENLAWLQRLVTQLCGATAALTLWLATYPTWRGAVDVRAALFGMIAVGVFLGWQVLCGAALVAGALHVAGQILRSVVPALGRVPWLGWLTAATVGWVCAWSLLAERLPQIAGPPWNAGWLLAAALLIEGLAWLSAWLGRRPAV